MPYIQDFSRNIAEFGFLTTLFGNSLLIYLTGCMTRQIQGPYKRMIIIFACFGLAFSVVEMLARPFVHSYNGAFVYFSLAKEISGMQEIVTFLLALYAGLYATLISFVAVQFIFRYFILNRYFIYLLYFLQLVQYAVMIFCGTSMHIQMVEKLKHFSISHQRLQKQFFKTLVCQITIPTVLFHMPIVPVLSAPFLNLQISIQSGIIYSLFSLYPPIDSFLLMYIVSDYRNGLSKLFSRNKQVHAGTNAFSTQVSVRMT
uniref:Serpentine Receptor, class J n=1 Tax=Caenorhabditis tropicalis TaxID=1561998 RepID=A0A1I7T611_9PELO